MGHVGAEACKVQQVVMLLWLPSGIWRLKCLRIHDVTELPAFQGWAPGLRFEFGTAFASGV